MKRIEKVSKVGEQVEIYYEDGSKKAISLEAIKGGIAWPPPGYYCIIGRYSFPDKNLKKKLILLTESEATLPEDLFQELYNDAKKLRCFEFYGEVDEANYEYYNQFSRFMERAMVDRIRLIPPPIKDWQAGILGILKYVRDNALDMPRDSILYGQLGSMTSEDQQDSRKSAFYAVNALKNLIGSFEIQPVFGRSVGRAGYVF
jgi:hypothetical protein